MYLAVSRTSSNTDVTSNITIVDSLNGAADRHVIDRLPWLTANGTAEVPFVITGLQGISITDSKFRMLNKTLRLLDNDVEVSGVGIVRNENLATSHRTFALDILVAGSLDFRHQLREEDTGDYKIELILNKENLILASFFET